MARAENNMAKSTKNKKEKTQEDDVFETKSNKKDQNKEVYKYSKIIMVLPIVFFIILFILQTQAHIVSPRYSLGLFLDIDNFKNNYIQKDQIIYITTCLIMYLILIYVFLFAIGKYRNFTLEITKDTITIKEDDILNIAKYEELYIVEIKKTFWGKIFNYYTIKMSHKIFGDKYIYFQPTPRKLLKKINQFIAARETSVYDLEAQRNERIKRLNNITKS
jgi:NADH:ubiquinone oxidoreductase subunit 5 (subunit L)/multisubunit Na+/H+ antiporter MnhA subunit